MKPISAVEKETEKPRWPLAVGLIVLAVGICIAVAVASGLTSNGGRPGSSAVGSGSSGSSGSTEVGDPEEMAYERIDAPSDDTFAIEADWIQLRFPSKWKDLVRVEQTDKEISIYAEIKPSDEKKVLSISEESSDDAFKLGDLNGTPVYATSYEIDFDDSWQEYEKDQVYAMQEELNTIADNLTQESDFTRAVS